MPLPLRHNARLVRVHPVVEWSDRPRPAPVSDCLRDVERVFELLPSDMSPMERVAVAQLLAAPGRA